MNELFHVDSRSDPTGYPGRYKFELGRTLHGVEKIEVVHGEVPSSIFSLFIFVFNTDSMEMIIEKKI